MQNLMFPKWLTWSLGLLLIVVLSLIALDKSYSLKNTIQDRTPANTISVSAEGKVKAVPDLATINLGVISNAPTAAEAQNQSTQKINAIIDFAKKQGVDAADIATSQFNIYPQQDYQNGRNVITGYTANQNITITARGIDKSTEQVSKILAGVTGAGANQINGVNLSFENPDDLRGQAREKAIETAKQKATDLANAAGLRLGRVVTVSEDNVGYPPMPYDQGLGIGGTGNMKATAPDIAPGNQDVIANMTITFEVK